MDKVLVSWTVRLLCPWVRFQTFLKKLNSYLSPIIFTLSPQFPWYSLLGDICSAKMTSETPTLIKLPLLTCILYKACSWHNLVKTFLIPSSDSRPTCLMLVATMCISVWAYQNKTQGLLEKFNSITLVSLHHKGMNKPSQPEPFLLDVCSKHYRVVHRMPEFFVCYQPLFG